MANNNSKPILAAHVTALLDSQPGARMGKAKVMSVGDGTLGRIKYGTGNPTLEVLDAIADHFRMETWRLLSPNDIQAQSQSARLSVQMLAEAVAALRQTSNRHGYTFDEVANADEIALAYEARQTLPEKPEMADLIDFGARVREILEKRGGEDGGESGSGEGGSAGGGNRGAHAGEHEAPRRSASGGRKRR